MRIGTDVSIQVCRNEGYVVMDYPAKEFKNNPTETDCRFTVSLPDYIREEIGWSPGDPMMCTDVYLNWDDLYDIYDQHVEGIDSMIGDNFEDISVPTPHDILSLADAVNSYCGLE